MLPMTMLSVFRLSSISATVEIGADQVALVVSKEAVRNSGVGTSDGDLRADRIINVQSQVSPDNARYRLISERAFTATLLPPRTGAVRNAWRCRR